MRQQLRPLFDRIVVKELDPPEVRNSGLILASQDTRPPQEGVVVAVGGGIDWWESVGFKMPVAPGDHVMFHYTVGAPIEVNEERLLVMRVGELLGVVEDVPAEHSLPQEAAERDGGA